MCDKTKYFQESFPIEIKDSILEIILSNQLTLAQVYSMFNLITKELEFNTPFKK